MTTETPDGFLLDGEIGAAGSRSAISNVVEDDEDGDSPSFGLPVQRGTTFTVAGPVKITKPDGTVEVLPPLDEPQFLRVVRGAPAKKGAR